MAPLGRHFTVWCLAALALGLGLGIALHGSETAWARMLEGSLRPVGRFWIVALQLSVVPLIFSQVVVSVMGTRGLGILGVRTMALFFVMLVAAGLFALVMAPPLVALYPVDPSITGALQASIPVAQAVGEGAPREAGLLDSIPAGVRTFFLGGNPLPLLLGAIVVALGAKKLPRHHGKRLEGTFQWLSDFTMQVVGWVLLITPLGIFAMTFGLARSAGGTTLGLLFSFVLIISAVTLAFTALYYPVTAALGGLSMREFARGVAPAQLVAAGTRSSLAALPALVEGGKDRLELPVTATGFVIPLAVSTVKVSRVTTTMVTLLFLAHVLDLPLGGARIAFFFATVVLLSFIVAGLPGRGPEASIFPAYTAAGIPLGGVILLEAVDAIPDIFKTVLNVTSIMSAAAIIAPRPRGRANG